MSNIYNGPHLRGHIYRLRCNTQRLVTGLHFFSSRVIASWNYLPVNVISFNSLNSFTLSLAKADLSEFSTFHSGTCQHPLLSVAARY